jgi:general secretion pathway protein H
VDNRPVAVVLRPGSYGFEWRQAGKWQPIGEKPFIEQKWGEGIEASLESGESRILFDSTGFAETTSLRLSRRGEEARVAVTGGGQVRVEP